MDNKFSPYVQTAVKNNLLESTDITYQNPSWGWAAGSCISTVHDLSIWIESLVNGQLFNKEYQSKWLNNMTPVNPKNPDNLYGYGIFDLSYNGNRLYSHSGQIHGYNSIMIYDPNNKITIVGWANLALSASGIMVASDIGNEIVKKIY